MVRAPYRSSEPRLSGTTFTPHNTRLCIFHADPSASEIRLLHSRARSSLARGPPRLATGARVAPSTRTLRPPHSAPSPAAHTAPQPSRRPHTAERPSTSYASRLRPLRAVPASDGRPSGGTASRLRAGELGKLQQRARALRERLAARRRTQREQQQREVKAEGTSQRRVPAANRGEAGHAARVGRGARSVLARRRRLAALVLGTGRSELLELAHGERCRRALQGDPLVAHARRRPVPVFPGTSGGDRDAQ